MHAHYQRIDRQNEHGNRPGPIRAAYAIHVRRGFSSSELTRNVLRVTSMELRIGPVLGLSAGGGWKHVA